MDPRRRLPPALIETARGYADGSKEPVDTRDASTVALMRDGSAGPELYLLRRHLGMEFAGGFCVVPGGGVDARDFNHEIGWAGPSAEEWGVLLECSAEAARALVCAAVRETIASRPGSKIGTLPSRRVLTFSGLLSTQVTS